MEAVEVNTSTLNQMKHNWLYMKILNSNTPCEIIYFLTVNCEPSSVLQYTALWLRFRSAPGCPLKKSYTRES
jgi:hypothetical protein